MARFPSLPAIVESKAIARKQVLFEGRVQGVGFRYTTERIAADFAVTGFVRNLPDGRVELVVEGEGKEVDAFLTEVGRRMDHFISEQQVDDRAATGEFNNFSLRY